MFGFLIRKMYSDPLTSPGDISQTALYGLLPSAHVFCLRMRQ